jgi:hypothetical protein
MRFVNCNNCPCLNSDNEYGSDCNLGYIQDYVLVSEEPRKHLHISPNCELVEIRSKNSVFVPEVSSQQPLAPDRLWREMAAANSLLFLFQAEVHPATNGGG